VDLYGNMPEFDAIREIARRRNVAIVEDAAEAIGSRYRGKLAGTFGDTAVFSFHGSKTVTTGEGGMLVTDREDLHKRALTLRDHGRPPGDKMFVNSEVAYKYKMSAMQAAMGLAQIERLDELVQRKRQIFAWYKEELDGAKGLVLNSEASNVLNTYWMVTVVVDPGLGWDKAKLMAAMSERGVDCRPIFSPLSSLPAFQNHPSSTRAPEHNPNSYAVGPHGINLPSGFNMDRETVQRVSRDLRAILYS
jgi:perosamine synthetase